MKKLRFLFVLVVYGVIILILLEGGLRLVGYQPWEPNKYVHLPKYRAYDQRLGWELIPGQFEVGPFNDLGDSMSLTVKKDTGRITRNSDQSVGDQKVLLIGGSFMMGFGLDNEQTVGWKLQEQFPNLDFRNLAVDGYGTYQSLMILEDELHRNDKPTVVIYGSISHHKYRDVAASHWMLSLFGANIPYVTLSEEGTLERQEPMTIKRLWFIKESALAFQVENVLNYILSLPRTRNKEQISELIILEMSRLCEEKGIVFYVAPFWYKKAEMERMIAFLDENQIDYMYCNVPLTPENIIKDDGHPGESVHDIWAERIAKRLIEDGMTLESQ